LENFCLHELGGEGKINNLFTKKKKINFNVEIYYITISDIF